MDKLEDAKRQAYDDLIKEFDKVETWSDFYDMMKERYTAFRKCGCPIHSFSALIIFYSFIVALRDLPEEGDIKVLLRHMAETMVHKTKERLDFEVTGATLRNSESLNALAMLLMRQGETESGEEHDLSDAAPKAGRVVH